MKLFEGELCGGTVSYLASKVKKEIRRGAAQHWTESQEVLNYSFKLSNNVRMFHFVVQQESPSEKITG